MDAYVHDAMLDMHIAREELMSVLAEVEDGAWTRLIPYRSRTLHDVLAHLAGADQAWALAAQGLLKGEGEQRPPLMPEAARAARNRAIERGRRRSERNLLDEMENRRRLLLALYELLEPRHLALMLRSYGDEHNSVRERIWLGYHDRLHAADVRRALRMTWHAPKLKIMPAIQPAVEALAPDETLYIIFNIDPVYWERPSSPPGWSYRQLLTHIASGDWVLQLHLRHIVEHGNVRDWPDVDAGNAERLEARRLSTVPALVEEYLSMRHATMMLLAQLKPKHLSLPIDLWWRPEPRRATMLDYILGFDAHERSHRDHLRPAMKYATARGGV